MNTKLPALAILAGAALMLVFSTIELNKYEAKVQPYDAFRESYKAQMQKMTGSGMAETRAEDARKYQSCDLHHNCKPFSEAKPAPVQNPEMGIVFGKFCKFSEVGSYAHVCAW